MAVTSGKEWRRLREEGIEVTLTSGMTVKVRGIGFAAPLRSGYVPDYLTAMVVEAIEGKKFTFPDKETPEQVLERSEFIGKLCQMMLVSPRIVDNPQEDDEIGMDDLDEADRYCLLSMWGTPTAWLANFRFGSKADLLSLLAKPVRPAVTEPVSEAEARTQAG